MRVTDFDGTAFDISPTDEFVGPPTREEWAMDQMEWAMDAA